MQAMSNPSQSLLTQQQLIPLFDALAQRGLVLATLVNVTQLPDEVWLNDKADKQVGTLLLIGHGGRLFWEHYQQVEPATDDPVDNFSATISAQALRQHLPDISNEQLFPLADCPVNLMALGRVLGWHTPSPLGMGINAKYGMWSAYRALWWLDVELETLPVENEQALGSINNLCSQCTTQACLQACPAQALNMTAPPNLQRCADYRIAVDSDCAATCLARMACPVTPEHRYTKEQMAYHYDLARSQIHLFSSHAQQNT